MTLEGERAPLVTVGTDATLFYRAPSSGEGGQLEAHLLGGAAFVRTVLGTPFDEAIGVEACLPVGAVSRVDHLVPRTLGALDVTGDLAPYGWRIGPGADAAWHEARGFGQRQRDAVRFAWHDPFGETGPGLKSGVVPRAVMRMRRLGPVALAGAAFLGTGERVLADAGLVRDLPHLASQASHAEALLLESDVPQVQASVLVDELGSGRIVQGRVRTASGYRFNRPFGRARYTELLGTYLDQASALGLAREKLTVMTDSTLEMVRATLDAGARSIALDPARSEAASSMAVWELLAEARERGMGVVWLVEPAALRSSWNRVMQAWQHLGFSAHEARGFTILVSARQPSDRSTEPTPAQFLAPAHVDALLRESPRFAEAVAS